VRIDLYIPKRFESSIRAARNILGKGFSEVVCLLIENYQEINVQLHIPTIRKMLQNNPKEIKKLRELLEEF